MHEYYNYHKRSKEFWINIISFQKTFFFFLLKLVKYDGDIIEGNFSMNYCDPQVQDSEKVDFPDFGKILISAYPIDYYKKKIDFLLNKLKFFQASFFFTSNSHQSSCTSKKTINSKKIPHGKNSPYTCSQATALTGRVNAWACSPAKVYLATAGRRETSNCTVHRACTTAVRIPTPPPTAALLHVVAKRLPACSQDVASASFDCIRGGYYRTTIDRTELFRFFFP